MEGVEGVNHIDVMQQDKAFRQQEPQGKGSAAEICLALSRKSRNLGLEKRSKEKRRRCSQRPRGAESWKALGAVGRTVASSTRELRSL